MDIHTAFQNIKSLVERDLNPNHEERLELKNSWNILIKYVSRLEEVVILNFQHDFQQDYLRINEEKEK